jgi:hypothetical protein
MDHTALIYAAAHMLSRTADNGLGRGLQILTVKSMLRRAIKGLEIAGSYESGAETWVSGRQDVNCCKHLQS